MRATPPPPSPSLRYDQTNDKLQQRLRFLFCTNKFCFQVQIAVLPHPHNSILVSGPIIHNAGFWIVSRLIWKRMSSKILSNSANIELSGQNTTWEIVLITGLWIIWEFLLSQYELAWAEDLYLADLDDDWRSVWREDGRFPSLTNTGATTRRDTTSKEPSPKVKSQPWGQ